MIEFTINDMSCGHCASMITKTVRALDDQAKVDVDLAQQEGPGRVDRGPGHAGRRR